jgi:uncharacterized cupin superfamily protein
LLRAGEVGAADPDHCDVDGPGESRLATMKIFNLNGDPEWDRTEEREGWRIKDAWVGAHIDAELIGASMYEVEPGDRQGPFHTHHANEEWVIVLRGEPTRRRSSCLTRAGWRA